MKGAVSRRLLMIGGGMDGQHLHIPDGSNEILVSLPSLYTLRTIQEGDGQSLAFLADESLTDSEALVRLMDGYASAKKEALDLKDRLEKTLALVSLLEATMQAMDQKIQRLQEGGSGGN